MTCPHQHTRIVSEQLSSYGTILHTLRECTVCAHRQRFIVSTKVSGQASTGALEWEE